ncbi:hypothetical protein ACEWY4_027295 [Coilia grayii]|uniref:Tudor domain-containing protein n=1 Tax=Coilia grayii TaxID=363190 RepID=A0ABD1IU69_9TELE
MSFIERKVPPVQLNPTSGLKSVLARKATKETHPNLIQNFPAHLIDMGLDVHFEVQYQKQTSSQLMAFLKTNSRTQFITLLTFIRHELGSSKRGRTQTYLMEVTSRQVGTGAATEPKVEAVAVTSAKEERRTRLPPDIRGPVFKVKCSSDGRLIYSCVVATSTELWDISDICTEMTNALLESKSRMGSGPSYPVESLDAGSSTDLVRLPVSQHQGDGEKRDEGGANGKSDDIPGGSKSSAGSPAVLAIPPFQIRKFEEMAVVVTHVVDPGHFYIQHQDFTLIRLTSEMDLSKSSACLVVIDRVPDIGSYAMGWFAKQQQWFRVRVSKICGINRDAFHTSTGSLESIEVEVQRVDFGDTGHLSLKDLRELSKELAAYPAQALQVALANVSPVDGIGWTGQAVSWFKDKVNNRTIYARLYPQERTVTVEIFMEKGKIGAMRRGASLSLRLAQNGHANHSQLKNTGLKRSLAQEQSRKEVSAWEKYLISCYAQNKK